MVSATASLLIEQTMVSDERGVWADSDRWFRPERLVCLSNVVMCDHFITMCVPAWNFPLRALVYFLVSAKASPTERKALNQVEVSWLV